MELTGELTSLKGVGPALAEKFAAVGIRTIAELLDYFPRTYNDYSEIQLISKIRPGMVTIEAEIKQAVGRYVRRGMHITEAVASDESGSVRLIWFNQPYRVSAIKTGQRYFITGKLELKRQRFSITNPSMEMQSDFPLHTARIVPIYRESKGITSTIFRRTLYQVLKYSALLPDPLPAYIREKYKLLAYGSAVRELHFPSSKENFAQARRSIGFIEVFELMLAAQLNKQDNQNEIAPKIEFDEKLAKQFVQSLPFQLTDPQRSAAWQIYKDIATTVPMNRLLEGDVGSGKTVVAGMAALMAMKAGLQTALMAPTELLARQHADTLRDLFESVGKSDAIGLLVGSMKPAQKAIAHQRIMSGDVGFIVGTQALLQDKVSLHKLGLVIIDEQHRFGVDQRKKLVGQSGHMPHILSMTATPIPRSLALTLYGELDISLLNTMPLGRKPIITKIISPNSRVALEKKIITEISAGRQVYIVCPLIKEGSGLKFPSAEQTYEKLRTTTFKNQRVGLLHGKLKDDEKNAVMTEFVQGNIDILVATTVIEVGVNIPNASIMVIEGADRFGLAQMHQLRGRVGRSTDQGFCFIVPSDSKAPSRRLRALEQSTNGFELAELDLELRGPGAIYGTLQHGELDLRIAKLTDVRLLAEVRSAVKEFTLTEQNIHEYPELKRRVRAAQAVVTLN
jgi:ATP-dependent DNA helicase RecG